MKPSAVELLFSVFSLSFMWLKSSFTSNCCSSSPELSCPGVITPWHFLLCVIYSVYSKQQNYGSCPSSKFEKVRGRSRSLVIVKAASLRRDTHLNVSGSVRDDEHFPPMINIPFPQMIAKLPVDRGGVHSQAVICSSCWLCCGMLPEEMLDHKLTSEMSEMAFI